MDISITELSKKTKPEILNAYKELMTNLEEAKNLAHEVQSPKSQEIIEKAKIHSPENLIKGLGEIKLSIHSYFESISEKLLNTSNTFDQLQEAIKTSQDCLQTIYNIQVAAVTLDQLVKDYDAKERELKAGNEKLNYDLSQTIELKKRDWQREIEEYNYTTQLKRKREKEQFEEEIAKQTEQIEERETNITAKEAEFGRLNAEVAGFKVKLEEAINQTREETLAETESNLKNQLALAAKDRAAEVNLLNLKIQHLEDLVRNQKDEINKLSTEVEKAYGQSQAIALKLVESSSNPSRETAQNLPLSNSHSLPR